MLSRQARVPRAARIIKAEAYVEGTSVDVRRHKGRVSGVFHIKLRAVEALAQEAQLHAGTQHSAEQAVLVGVLHGQALVGEQSYLVVEQRHAHAMVVFQEVKGHVRANVHRPRVVLESGEAQCVYRRHVQLLLLSDGAGVEIRFQVPVVAERHVILRAGPRDGEQQQ